MKSDDGRFRGQLAQFIVILSLIGILVASVVAIWLATDAGRPEMSRLVFASVLPLLGTWVGTVLAFYFARENLQAATDSTVRLRAPVEPQTPVSQVMIPRAQIQANELQPGQAAASVKLSDLYGQMTTSSYRRIPILDEHGAVVYVIHDSTITGFAASLTPPAPPDQLTQTIGDLLGVATYKAMIEAIGFVGPKATVAEARNAMRAVNQCNDVFVTLSGQPTESVIGWITNTDLASVE